MRDQRIGGWVTKAAAWRPHSTHRLVSFRFFVYLMAVVGTSEARMKIRPHERQAFVDICKEELEAATRRIDQRICENLLRVPEKAEDGRDSIRQFYEELSGCPWTEEDEKTLGSLANNDDADVKRMMRDAFRKSRVYPIPSFAALMNSLKRTEDLSNGSSAAWANRDAISAADRERLANLLYTELGQAVRQIAFRLQLSETKTEILREQLEDVQGHIISRFTPLV